MTDDCAEEGGTHATDYSVGMRQCVGKHPTDRVLLVIFIAALAAVVLSWGTS